jgi:NAD(P)-dependent dehydrogenase (short-subunit alcohol dehydrogenase family)
VQAVSVKRSRKNLPDEGACIVVNDNDDQTIGISAKNFQKEYGKMFLLSASLDVTSPAILQCICETAAFAFGGVDIMVNCAGLSISKPLEEHTDKDWDLLYDVLVKGQFTVTQEGVNIMRKQDMGGDILNIVSKNALVSGPNNAGYGSAKAAQLHLSRLNAAELGKTRSG